MNNEIKKIQEKMGECIKKYPFPFKVIIRNKEDEEQAKVLESIMKHDWEHGGRERFFKKFGEEYRNEIINEERSQFIGPFLIAHHYEKKKKRQGSKDRS